MNNNYDFERNLHLTGIEKNTRGMKNAMQDKLYLEVYGKEAYYLFMLQTHVELKKY